MNTNIDIHDTNIRPCNSTAIKQYIYSYQHQALIVWFRAQPYLYVNVPESLYEGLEHAESKGRYIHEKLKEQDYEFVKLSETQDKTFIRLSSDDDTYQIQIRKPKAAPIKPKWARGLLNLGDSVALA